MKPRCLECGKRQVFFRKNYAGFDVRQAIRNSNTFGFPDRYNHLILPGNPQKDFLCVTCANKRTVTCSVHGRISDKFSVGHPPLCLECQHEDKEQKIHPHLSSGSGLSGVNINSRRFKDPKHSFSMDIPDGWEA